MREELLARGARELALPPLEDHYAEGSRRALHHVERGLFETEPGARVDPGAAIAFHSAGGERAEVELAGARVLELLREGVEPGDVAVVFRAPASQASLIEQVFGAYGIPYSLDRSIPFGHTGLGRGLLALVRCAILDGSAEDLLAYLRTPGPAARAGACRPPRGAGPPGGRSQRRAGAAAVGARALGPRRSRSSAPGS